MPFEKTLKCLNIQHLVWFLTIHYTKQGETLHKTRKMDFITNKWIKEAENTPITGLMFFECCKMVELNNNRLESKYGTKNNRSNNSLQYHQTDGGGTADGLISRVTSLTKTLHTPLHPLNSLKIDRRKEKMNEIENWESVLGDSFLNAKDVTDSEHAYAVISTEQVEYDGKKRMRLHLEKEEKKWVFDLNVTNTVFLKDHVEHPKDVIGKKIYFRKVTVTNPSTKKEVDALRISKVE